MRNLPKSVKNKHPVRRLTDRNNETLRRSPRKKVKEASRRLDAQEEKVKKCLSGYKFFLDIPSNAKMVEIQKRIRSLGGEVEEFLSKEIRFVVTSQQIDKDIVKHTACGSVPSPLSAAAPSPLLPLSNRIQSVGQIFSPMSSDTHQLSIESAKATIRSNSLSQTRGRLAVSKSLPTRKGAGTNDIIRKAFNLGAKVISMNDFIEEFMKKKTKEPLRDSTKSLPLLHPARTKKTVTQLKETKLREAYFKIEDRSKHFRPITFETKAWPRIYYSDCINQNPFEVPRKKRARESETSVKVPAIPDPVEQPSSCHQPSEKTVAKKTEGKKEDKKIEKDEKKQGFCDCCGVRYYELDKHLKMETHKKFAENNANFAALDSLIMRGRSFEDFLRKLKRISKEKRSLESSSTSSSFIKIEAATTNRIKCIIDNVSASSLSSITPRPHSEGRVHEKPPFEGKTHQHSANQENNKICEDVQTVSVVRNLNIENHMDDVNKEVVATGIDEKNNNRPPQIETVKNNLNVGESNPVTKKNDIIGKSNGEIKVDAKDDNVEKETDLETKAETVVNVTEIVNDTENKENVCNNEDEIADLLDSSFTVTFKDQGNVVPVDDLSAYNPANSSEMEDEQIKNDLCYLKSTPVVDYQHQQHREVLKEHNTDIGCDTPFKAPQNFTDEKKTKNIVEESDSKKLPISSPQVESENVDENSANKSYQQQYMENTFCEKLPSDDDNRIPLCERPTPFKTALEVTCSDVNQSTPRAMNVKRKSHRSRRNHSQSSQNVTNGHEDDDFAALFQEDVEDCSKSPSVLITRKPDGSFTSKLFQSPRCTTMKPGNVFERSPPKLIHLTDCEINEHEVMPLITRRATPRKSPRRQLLMPICTDFSNGYEGGNPVAIPELFEQNEIGCLDELSLRPLHKSPRPPTENDAESQNNPACMSAVRNLHKDSEKSTSHKEQIPRTSSESTPSRRNKDKVELLKNIEDNSSGDVVLTNSPTIRWNLRSKESEKKQPVDKELINIEWKNPPKKRMASSPIEPFERKRSRSCSAASNPKPNRKRNHSATDALEILSPVTRRRRSQSNNNCSPTSKHSTPRKTAKTERATTESPSMVSQQPFCGDHDASPRRLTRSHSQPNNTTSSPATKRRTRSQSNTGDIARSPLVFRSRTRTVSTPVNFPEGISPEKAHAKPEPDCNGAGEPETNNCADEKNCSPSKKQLNTLTVGRKQVRPESEVDVVLLNEKLERFISMYDEIKKRKTFTSFNSSLNSTANKSSCFREDAGLSSQNDNSNVELKKSVVEQRSHTLLTPISRRVNERPLTTNESAPAHIAGKSPMKNQKSNRFGESQLTPSESLKVTRKENPSKSHQKLSRSGGSDKTTRSPGGPFKGRFKYASYSRSSLGSTVRNISQRPLSHDDRRTPFNSSRSTDRNSLANDSFEFNE